MEAKNMNMRPMPKKDNSNGLIGGALGAAIGTALGATFGVGGAYAYNRLTEDNNVEPPLDPELMEADEDVEVVEAEPEHHHVHHVHHLDNVYIVNDNDVNNDEEGDGDVILTPPEDPPMDDEEEQFEPDIDDPYISDVSDNDDSSIQIVSYERITTDDGSQMDVANIIYQGHHAAIIDVDLDGWADALQLDEDGNNVISEDEFHPLEADMRIEMAPLAEAANYQPENDEIDPDLPTAFVGTEEDYDTPPEIEEDDDVIASNDIEPDFENNGDISDMNSDTYFNNNDTPITDGTDDLVLV
jgi:hypothetical protein